MKSPLTLAIDTSCDETSVSVVDGLTVLSNILPSQMEYHKKYGGVVPRLAKFAHQERIDNVIQESLKRSQRDISQIDLVAVTIGPGLAIALEVGIKKAIELAKEYEKPLMLINHMEGHLYSGLGQRKPNYKNPKNQNNYFDVLMELKEQMPGMGFLVSGGHTEIVLVNEFGKYEIVGETVDDSAGEAYDKSGRLLGLGYPAGPVISDFSRMHRKNMEIKTIRKSNGLDVLILNKNTGSTYKLPIAMANSGDLNFSFSGLKTAMKYLINDIAGEEVTLEQQLSENIKGLTKDQVLDLTVAFESAALTQLTLKLDRAIEKYKPKVLFLGGGVVASNRFKQLVRKICKSREIELIYPTQKKLTTDNAAMIAVAANVNVFRLGGIENLNTKLFDEDFKKMNNIYYQKFDNIDRLPSLSLSQH